jgi:hypothetical protein
MPTGDVAGKKQNSPAAQSSFVWHAGRHVPGVVHTPSFDELIVQGSGVQDAATQ